MRSWKNFSGLYMAFVIGCVCLLAHAQETATIDVTVVPSKPSYAPGDTVIFGLRVTIPKGFHLYDNPLGPGIGKPMTCAVQGPEQIDWIDLLKPKSKKYRPPVGGWVWAFDGETAFFLRGVVRTDAAPGAYRGAVTLSGLICQDACIPVEKTIDLVMSVGSAAPSGHFSADAALAKRFAKSGVSQALEKPPVAGASPVSGLPSITLKPEAAPAPAPTTSIAWNYTPQEAGSDLNLLLAILLGFIAGIILNAMPCVLPVLGVKIISFSEGAGLDRKKAVLHSLVFSAGVVSVFMLLAALATFANFSWGQQFQDPRALVAIITLIVVFSLGMFDVFIITVPGAMGNAANRKPAGLLGHFSTGVFATVLATPCSGPFLGAVLAWSVTQPAAVIFAVYGAIGLGMSFPYVLLSASSRLARSIPRPGVWMEDFKKIMGFLLLGFAVYLMLGLPADLVVPTVLFCLTAAFAVVLYVRIAPFGSTVARKAVGGTVSLATAAGGLYLAFFMVYPAFSGSAAAALEQEDKVWRDFHPDSLVAAHAQGRSVMLDFTANWCMNCQYNYIAVLTRPPIVDLIREKNVLALKVDMTTSVPVQDSLLRALGSRSVPFLAIFPGDKPYEPLVMRDVLTVGKVRKALEKLHEPVGF